MSQLLTVTIIPEEKFRRFSRFPYVAATKTDERYNSVYIKSPSPKPNKKSSLKFLESHVCSERSREVTFDFIEKSTSNKMRETVPRVSPHPNGQVVQHQIDITNRNELTIEDGKVFSKDNDDFAKLKEKFLADSREKERTFVKSKEVELSKVQQGKSDWCSISYVLPKAPNSVLKKDRQAVPGKEFCGSKQQKLVGENDMVDVSSDNFGKNANSNICRTITKVGGDRCRDNSLLELIDFGHPVPNSEDKILHAVRKPVQLVKNTRFGGDIKLTAYRPSTTMDRFRKGKLEVIKESSVDVEEGKTIWTEVDTIIQNSTNRRKRTNQKMNHVPVNCLTQQKTTFTPNVAVNADQTTERNADLKYSIEVRPYFRSRNVSGVSITKERIWPDETESDKGIEHVENTITGIENTVERDLNKSESYKHLQFRGFKPKCFSFEDDTKGSYNLGHASQELAKSGIHANVNHIDLDERNDCLMIHHSHIQGDDEETGAGKKQLIYPGYGRSFSGPVIHLPIEGACNHKGVTMTTMLPRITSSRTPLPTGITQPPPRSHSSASLYVPYPPKELSSSMDYLRLPGRINPLAPPPPRRRINWSWETTDQHHENEKRSLLMQKREHTRYHSAWSKAFYGAPAEKEAYRRHFREVLKQQMSDKDKMEKVEFQEKIKETEQAISYDRDCRMNDAKEYHRKHSYLMQYRDGNKQQMEDRWADTRYNRELENRIDRERLRYNPINWSCTLK